MNKLVTELKDKQLQFDQKIKEAEDIDKKLKIVSADIICWHNKKQNFDHKKIILDDFQSAGENNFATIRKENRKLVFSISACLENNVNLLHQEHQH